MDQGEIAESGKIKGSKRHFQYVPSLIFDLWSLFYSLPCNSLLLFGRMIWYLFTHSSRFDLVTLLTRMDDDWSIPLYIFPPDRILIVLIPIPYENSPESCTWRRHEAFSFHPTSTPVLSSAPGSSIQSCSVDIWSWYLMITIRSSSVIIIRDKDKSRYPRCR